MVCKSQKTAQRGRWETTGCRWRRGWGITSTLKGWGCTRISPERTDAKPESWRKHNDWVVQGDSEEETWHSSWAPLEQHSSRLAHLVLFLGAPCSEFLLLLETFICWGFFLGTMLRSESGPPSGAPKANTPFPLGRQLSLSFTDAHGEHSWIVFCVLLSWPAVAFVISTVYYLETAFRCFPGCPWPNRNCPLSFEMLYFFWMLLSCLLNRGFTVCYNLGVTIR